jgi:hypothetical protein
MLRFYLIRAFACLMLAAFACVLTAPRAEACDGRLIRAAFAPLRLANQVRVNRMEARASRGNQVAAARLENTTARMCSRR